MDVLHATLTTRIEAATTTKRVATSWEGGLSHYGERKVSLGAKGGEVVGRDNERRRVRGD